MLVALVRCALQCSQVCAVMLVLWSPLTASAQITSRVSVGAGGAQANPAASYDPSISADGRYVAFTSLAASLVMGDTNNTWDVFVHDRQTGLTTRVSVGAGGAQGNGLSDWPSISADGRFVAFRSEASNLVTGDTNNGADVFVHDRQTWVTTRVSVGAGGAQANGPSQWLSISGDGRYVAFVSEASNLVAGDTNSRSDVFVHDRQAGVTTRVSVAAGGAQGNNGSGIFPCISADGRYVAFTSFDSNLVAGDTNNRGDVFVHDRQTGVTTRVSVGAGGTQGNDSSGWPSISADGRYVAFDSLATNLVTGDTNDWQDAFVHDRQTGVTTRVSVGAGGTQGDDYSNTPTISADGRYVAFQSRASNLVTGDTNYLADIFVHDRQLGVTTRVSVGAGGTEGDHYSTFASISADGRHVAFSSYASNLVAGDTNGGEDVFVHDRFPPAPCSADFNNDGYLDFFDFDDFVAAFERGC
jgi:Tol biopolymer transport system component